MLNIQQTIGTLSKKYWYETDQTQMKILIKKITWNMQKPNGI
jgi:hypothetical protein